MNLGERLNDIIFSIKDWYYDNKDNKSNIVFIVFWLALLGYFFVYIPYDFFGIKGVVFTIGVIIVMYILEFIWRRVDDSPFMQDHVIPILVRFGYDDEGKGLWSNIFMMTFLLGIRLFMFAVALTLVMLGIAFICGLLGLDTCQEYLMQKTTWIKSLHDNE